jgi:hypothetical protein
MWEIISINDMDGTHTCLITIIMIVPKLNSDSVEKLNGDNVAILNRKLHISLISTLFFDISSTLKFDFCEILLCFWCSNYTSKIKNFPGCFARQTPRAGALPLDPAEGSALRPLQQLARRCEAPPHSKLPHTTIPKSRMYKHLDKF